MCLQPEQFVQLTTLRQTAMEIQRQVVGEHDIRQGWWRPAAGAVLPHPWALVQRLGVALLSFASVPAPTTPEGAMTMMAANVALAQALDQS